MSRWLEIFKNGRVYEIENDQAVKVTETHGQVNALIDALRFSLATTFTIAPSDKQLPDVAAGHGQSR
jgi:hypothetical protein